MSADAENKSAEGKEAGGHKLIKIRQVWEINRFGRTIEAVIKRLAQEPSIPLQLANDHESRGMKPKIYKRYMEIIQVEIQSTRAMANNVIISFKKGPHFRC